MRGQFLGVQEGLVRRLQMAIGSMGLQAELALSEDEAYSMAQQSIPEKVFCQFWEEEKMLDAKSLADRFARTPVLSKIPFYVYCETASLLEALKSFREERILSFTETSELLRKSTKA